jgi:single-strand DNA-binding protein
MDLFQISLSGRVGQNAQVRTVQDQLAVSTTVAINEPIKNQAGEWQDHTTWVALTYWTRNQQDAEKMAKRLEKGNQVFIQGKPRVETYTTRDGNQAAQIKIGIEKAILLRKAENAAASTVDPQPNYQTTPPAFPNSPADQRPEATPEAIPEAPKPTDDLPF